LAVTYLRARIGFVGGFSGVMQAWRPRVNGR
jgi:hypothetical protein